MIVESEKNILVFIQYQKIIALHFCKRNLKNYEKDRAKILGDIL